MKDRVAVNPGRVLITPENGSPYYATMTRADNPTQEGTPLNKNSLLKDTTAALLGGNADMVPDEALVALKNMVDGLTPKKIGAANFASGSYVGTGRYGSSAKNSLTFPFEPIAVVVMCEKQKTPDQYDKTIDGGWVWLRGTQAGYSVASFDANQTSACMVPISWNGNTVSWYVTNYYFGNVGQARCQLNYSGYVYQYIAIG